MRFAIPFAAAALSFSGGALRAQTFDASGNSMLNGAYYMRDVAYSGVSEVGVIGLAQTLYGTRSLSTAKDIINLAASLPILRLRWCLLTRHPGLTA